jgi:hypothetical protein
VAIPRRVLLGDISFTAAKTFPRECSGHGGQIVEGDVDEDSYDEPRLVDDTSESL